MADAGETPSNYEVIIDYNRGVRELPPRNASNSSWVRTTVRRESSEFRATCWLNVASAYRFAPATPLPIAARRSRCTRRDRIASTPQSRVVASISTNSTSVFYEGRVAFEGSGPYAQL